MCFEAPADTPFEVKSLLLLPASHPFRPAAEVDLDSTRARPCRCAGRCPRRQREVPGVPPEDQREHAREGRGRKLRERQQCCTRSRLLRCLLGRCSLTPPTVLRSWRLRFESSWSGPLSTTCTRFPSPSPTAPRREAGLAECQAAFHKRENLPPANAAHGAPLARQECGYQGSCQVDGGVVRCRYCASRFMGSDCTTGPFWCPNDCRGKGECVQGVCICHDGYW